jgi:Zinc carboxypeptidase
VTQFPEVVSQVTVGKSYLGKTIPGYAISMNMSGSNWNQNALSKPAIFINAAHHARELSTIAMTEYVMLRLLFDYV